MADRLQRGLFLVLIGPDGAGKSTLLAAAGSRLGEGFSGLWRFHWRPGVLPKLGRAGDAQSGEGAAAAPPAEARYGGLVSFARYCYYLLDFLLGYWVKIVPLRKRGVLVIGERWYFDVIISPQRYGFALPGWLLSAGGRLVPRPDLVLLLKADPETIHRRKPELDVSQIRGLMCQMEGITRTAKAGYVVDTGAEVAVAVDALLAHVRDAVVPNGHGAREWRAFPNAHHPKIWVDRREGFSQSLQLYHPYSRAGRIAKALVTAMPAGLGRTVFSSGPTSAQRRLLLSMSSTICRTLKNEQITISYATGTPGPHRKMTAQASQGHDVLAYVKISTTPSARRLLENETVVLQHLPGMRLDQVSFPELLAIENLDDALLVFSSAPAGGARQRALDPDRRDVHFLRQLIRSGRTESRIIQVLDDLHADAVYDHISRNQPDAAALLRSVFEYLKLTHAAHGVITTFGHGDYAPWNTLCLSDGCLYVFDWEYAVAGMPVLNDLCHRVFMPLRLVRGASPAAVVKVLSEMGGMPLLGEVVREAGLSGSQLPGYLLLYLLTLGVRESQGEEGVISEYLLECIQAVLEKN